MSYALKRVPLALALSFAAIAAQAADLATPLANVKFPENMAKANGKIYVSTNDALYVLSGSGSSWQSAKVPVKYRSGASAEGCNFTGLTTMGSKVFSVCSENIASPGATKHLFVLDSSSPSPGFNEITFGDPDNLYITNVALPNGLTNDGSNLYLADHGAPLLPGKIVKLTLNAGATGIASQSTMHNFFGCKANGVKYSNGKLYVTLNPFSYVGLSQLYRYDVGSSSLSNGKPMYNSWSFLDDFALVNDGFLVADYMGGRVLHVKEDGTVDGAALTDPTLPSSVTLSDDGKVVVTHRQTTLIATGATGSVHVYDSLWGKLTLR